MSTSKIQGPSKWAGASLGVVGGLLAACAGSVLVAASEAGYPLSPDWQFGMQVLAAIGGTMSTIGRASAVRPVHWIPRRLGRTARVIRGSRKGS